MNDRLLHFLIVYDAGKGSIVEDVREFADSDEALAAYRAAEQRLEENPRMTVVLVGADSLETVKITHPNFWNAMDVREAVTVAGTRKH